MKCVEYKSVETEESAIEEQGAAQQSKLFVVPGCRTEARPVDRVAARVAAVLDFELAQGSMPA